MSLKGIYCCVLNLMNLRETSAILRGWLLRGTKMMYLQVWNRNFWENFRKWSGQRKNEKELKLAFSEFYLSLIIIQDYQKFNTIGFQKIMKKFDKNLSCKSGAEWIATKLSGSELHSSQDIEKLIVQVKSNSEYYLFWQSGTLGPYNWFFLLTCLDYSKTLVSSFNKVGPELEDCIQLKTTFNRKLPFIKDKLRF